MTIIKPKNPMVEAATVKTRAQRLIKDVREILKDKSLPDDLRSALESVSTSLKKKWADLDTDKKLGSGKKGLSNETDDEPGGEMEESEYGSYERPWIPYGVVSFADLDKIAQSEEMAETIQVRTNQFTGMVRNIMYSSAEQTPDKITALTTLFDEFVLVLSDAIADPGDMGETGAPAAAEPVVDPDPEPISETFAESLVSSAVILADPISEADPVAGKPLEISVRIIQPGWGNTRDNHYYPAEMLRRDAKKFDGAKMYETDHVQSEKSTRTWVSTVKEITGFTDDGAPIGRVIVHDPGFAERIRNLSAADMLSKMECSILAQGNARSGFELNGRKGKVVESIAAVDSVDWVTRAGAGGQALSIAESADGTPADPADETPVEPVTPAANIPVEPETDPEPETVPVVEEPASETEPVPAVPVYLNEAEVAPYIAKLAKPVAARVLAGKYTNSQEVEKAIEKEIAYIKSLTGSGSVVLMGESRSTRREIRPSVVAETIAAVNKKFLLGG